MTGKRFTLTDERKCYFIPLIVDNQINKKLGISKAMEYLNALHEENEHLNDTVDNVTNHLNEVLEENAKLLQERNYFERKKTSYLTKLNECRLENTDLKNKYKQETEFLIRQNVKLKEEMTNLERLHNGKCKHSK